MKRFNTGISQLIDVPGVSDFSQYDTGTLSPNQNPGASEVWNNPAYAGFMDPRVAGDNNNLDHTSNESNIGFDNGKFHTPQNPHTDLLSLRRDFPYLPIMPLPPQVRSVFLTTAGVPVEMTLPKGAVMGMFSASAYYLAGIHGNAEVPSATNTIVDASNETKSFQPAPGIFYYLKGVNYISFVSPNANTIVSGLFYMPSEWPHN